MECLKNLRKKNVSKHLEGLDEPAKNEIEEFRKKLRKYRHDLRDGNDETKRREVLTALHRDAEHGVYFSGLFKSLFGSFPLRDEPFTGLAFAAENALKKPGLDPNPETSGEDDETGGGSSKK